MPDSTLSVLAGQLGGRNFGRRGATALSVPPERTAARYQSGRGLFVAPAGAIANKNDLLGVQALSGHPSRL